MTLQIEEGKFYRDTKDNLIGPMVACPEDTEDDDRAAFYVFGELGQWAVDGSVVYSDITPRYPLVKLVNPFQSKQEAGAKFDAGKARIDLIAPEFLFGTAEILDFGAQKYGERNWEAGMSWSRPFAALMRHMWAWWRGEKLDDETGKSHLWHAACCLMFLIAFEARDVGKDDRAQKSA